MNDIKAKLVRNRNPDFIIKLKSLVKDFEEGKIESFIVFTRDADGNTCIDYSYSDTFTEDAANLMAMGIARMGFSR